MLTASGIAASRVASLSTMSAPPISSVYPDSAALNAGHDSLFVIASRLTNALSANLAKHGQEQRLPVIGAWREYADNGRLLSYGPNRAFEATQIARYVEQVRKGTKPADLPIQQPTKF